MDDALLVPGVPASDSSTMALNEEFDLPMSVGTESYSATTPPSMTRTFVESNIVLIL